GGVVYNMTLDNASGAATINGVSRPLGDCGPTITMYDLRRGRVVVMDRAKKTRRTFTSKQLLKAVATLRAAADTDEKRQRFGIDAIVQPSGPFDSDASKEEREDLQGQSGSGALEIAFDGNRYHCSLNHLQQHPEIATAYAQFTQWACRLRVVQPRGLMPFASMTLAETLQTVHAVPDVMHLEMPSQHGLGTDVYRAEHHLIQRLSDQDRRRISAIGDLISQCQDDDQ
ncbi:MAG: hypothetical protein AAFP90_23800, partial [Planctomycetota bacterium]